MMCMSDILGMLQGLHLPFVNHRMSEMYGMLQGGDYSKAFSSAPSAPDETPNAAKRRRI